MGTLKQQTSGLALIPTLNSMLDIFNGGPFVPHGHCYLWKTGLVGLHITADALIVLAYYSIPITLLYFVRQRKDLPFKRVFLLFGAFIILCGTTHLLDIWTLWYPTYWFSGAIKAATALVSILTATELVSLVPRALALPSPKELRQLNTDLEASQARLASILDTANDAIISISSSQQVTRFNRAAERLFGFDANEILGRPLHLLMPEEHWHNVYSLTGTNATTSCNEIVGLRKNGTQFAAEASASELDVAGEKIVTIFLRDITHRKQTEAEFKEQQHFLRQVIDNNPNLIFVKDYQGKFTLANQALAEVYNTTIENIIGKTDIDFCPNPTDSEQYAKADRQVIQTLQPLLNVEESFTTSEGTVRHFQSVKAPLLSSDGKTRYVLGVAHDVTSLKQIQNDLRQKTEELELFFSSTLDLLCIANIEGYFLRLNPEWKQALGYQIEELQGRKFLDFVHPEDLEPTLEAIAQLSEQQQILSFTNRYRHQDGSYRWLEWRSMPSGDLIYAAARDITERKQSELEQRNQQAFLRQVINIVPNVIFAKDKEGHILVVNQAGATAHGTTVEEMLGKRETDFNLNFSQEQLDEFLAVNRQVMESRQPHVALSQSIITKTGEIGWYQTVISPLTDAKENVIGIVGATTDITNLKRTEQDLKRAKEAAEAANKAKSAFIANMSHEFRTPLNVILGFAQVMHLDPLSTPDQQENLQAICRSGEHLLGLINDVLDLSKIEAGCVSADENIVDLIDLLNSVKTMFSQQARAKGLELHAEIASDLPQHIITDANKLRQILLNLLSNAIKFTSEGRVIFRVSVDNDLGFKRSSPQQLIHFEISDTGVGIDAAEIETIFSAFTQTEIGKASPNGTGLGLTISRNFAQLLGGEITVRSILERGSTFSFKLPIRLAKPACASPDASTEKVVRLASGQPRYRALIVDDHPVNRKLLVRLLNRIGLEVFEATNGKEAVTQWRQWKPHVIYMDIRMPILNGCEATQQIRSAANGEKPIIIALTADTTDSSRQLAFAAGCDDYMSKPFQLKVLLDKLADHLGVKYLYSAEQMTYGDKQQTTTLLHPSDLLAMPFHWITAMQEAALLGDDRLAEELIEQIPIDQKLLRDGLSQLVRHYHFKQVLELTKLVKTNEIF